jgi:hypothetical protein
MRKKPTPQSGFAHIGLTLLLVMVLGVVGGGGYYVWKKNHDQKKSADTSQSDNKAVKITNYDECTKDKGSRIQESYPAVCVTADNQHFTQPVAQKYLTIKEWGIKMQLPMAIADATYHIVTDNKYLPPSAFLSTSQLDASKVCQQYYESAPESSMPSYQWLERYSLSAKVSFDEGQTTLTAEQAAKERPDSYKRIGEHVYRMNKGNGMPCSEQTADQSDAYSRLFDTLTAE